jgi:hypothetical protein
MANVNKETEKKTSKVKDHAMVHITGKVYKEPLHLLSVSSNSTHVNIEAVARILRQNLVSFYVKYLEWSVAHSKGGISVLALDTVLHREVHIYEGKWAI